MYNDSYIVENGWDQLYERSETISQPKDCPECINGEIVFSSCCGANIEDGVCQDPACGFECEEVVEDCSTCNGEGEIYE